MSYKKSCNKMPDLSGHKFGRWLVLHKDLDRLDHKGIKSYYICQCDCGSIHSVSAYGYEMEHQKVVGVKQKIESLSIIIGTVCQELIFIGFLDV